MSCRCDFRRWRSVRDALGTDRAGRLAVGGYERKRFCVGFSVPGGPGDDRLSRVLRHSTIGAKAFDGRVRDGIGSYRLARATRPARNGRRTTEDRITFLSSVGLLSVVCQKQNWIFRVGRGRERSNRPSSVLCRLRSRLGDESVKPVERLVPVGFTHCCASTSGLSTWSSSTALIGRTGFEAGFPLRCLQRLSIPHIATLHRRWRDDRSTRDAFTPVLSY